MGAAARRQATQRVPRGRRSERRLDSGGSRPTPPLHTLLTAADARGAVVSAVRHGPAALVGVKAPDGRPVVAGKRVAAFTNAEEKGVKLDTVVPFALEPRLREQGARFESGPLWNSFAVRDGRLITGQNPASSAAVAREVLAALRKQ